MDGTTTQLNGLIEKALGVIEKCGISPKTVRDNYELPFGRIKKFCEEPGVSFSEEMLERYVEHVDQLAEEGALSRYYCDVNRHAALLLLDCVQEEEPIWRQYRRRYFKYTPDREFVELTESVIDSIRPTSDSHAARLRSCLRQFFCYMEDAGIAGCDSIDNGFVRQFITNIADSKPNEAEYIIHALRVLLGYLAAKDICHVSLDPALYSPSVRHHPVIPCFSREEVRAMIDACDTATSAGKRRKAAILLAVTTGLRGCDIAALELGRIDWAKEEIGVVQKKTSVSIVAPLVPAAGNALADYLLNARPDCGSNRVFVTLKAPYRPIGTGSLAELLEVACAKAGIKKVEHRAFHSLRRSAGTWMAQASVPIQTIAQVLGHASISSSMPYIAFDPQTLDTCPLDFSCVPLAKGGAYA
jgi:site-specific recombinase XerD